MPKPDQLICRKDIKTGSLIATVNQCMTRSEWKEQEQQNRDTASRLQGVGFCDGRGGPCLPPCPTPGASC